MAIQLEMGNASMLFTSPNDLFSERHTTGYLEVYDERHRPPFPPTAQTIRTTLQMIWTESSAPVLWKAGRVPDWIEALGEHAEQTFRSVTQEERQQQMTGCLAL